MALNLCSTACTSADSLLPTHETSHENEEGALGPSTARPVHLHQQSNPCNPRCLASGWDSPSAYGRPKVKLWPIMAVKRMPAVTLSLVGLARPGVFEVYV
jgi:hypothetical protein